MATDDWTDRIMSDRLAVDQEFVGRIADSSLTRGEWGMIMTVVDFDIEDPGDPDRARLVGDTSRIPDILPQVQKVRNRTAMGPSGGESSSDEGAGLFGSIKSALGLGGSKPDPAMQRDAEELVEAYAAELQAHLEDEGKWEEIRAAAAE